MRNNEDKRKTYSLLAQYMSVVFILPSAVVGGYFVGKWLDGRWDTYPWVTVIMVLLGTVAGFVEVFRITCRK